MSKTIHVAQYMSHSDSNGPGSRCVLWVQGCDKRCPQCCNPSFQDFNGEYKEYEPDLLAFIIKKSMSQHDLRGLTLSGGEPLNPKHQEGIMALCKLLKNSKVDIMAFTGYEELPEWATKCLDMAIAGPYEADKAVKTGIVASSNQKIIRLTNKFNDVSDEELLHSPRKIELKIQGTEVQATGLIGIDEVKRMTS